MNQLRLWKLAPFTLLTTFVVLSLSSWAIATQPKTSQIKHLAQAPSTQYPLEIEKGLVGDSRYWVRVNGWILNVEEWGGALKLASFAEFCKKPTEVNGQSATLLLETWYQVADGKPVRRGSILMADGSIQPLFQDFPHPGKLIDQLVPPPTPTVYPLQVKPRKGKQYAQVNGQPILVEAQIQQKGETYLFFRLLYSLQEKESTVDGGSNKRRVFYSQKTGTAHEVITRYNGQVVRVTPLPNLKRIDQVMPFAYFLPGYSLTENARGYRGGSGFAGLVDPLSLPENRPTCAF